MKKIIVLLCVVFIAAASGIIIGCGSGGGGDDQTQAKEAADNFLKAYNDLDVDGIVAVVTKSDVDQMDIEEFKKAAELQKEQAGTLDFQLDYTLGKVAVDGDNATVEAKAKYQGQETDIVIYLAKEDGKWKVDMEKTFQTGSQSDQSDQSVQTEPSE